MRNGTVDATFETVDGDRHVSCSTRISPRSVPRWNRAGSRSRRLSIAEQPAQDAPERGSVGDDRGSEDRQAEDRPSKHAGDTTAQDAPRPRNLATDGDPAPDDPAVVALGERGQHDSVGGAGIADPSRHRSSNGSAREERA